VESRACRAVHTTYSRDFPCRPGLLFCSSQNCRKCRISISL